MATNILLRDLESLVRIQAGNIAGDAAAESTFKILSMGKDGSWMLVVPSQACVPKYLQEALKLAASFVRTNFGLLADPGI